MTAPTRAWIGTVPFATAGPPGSVRPTVPSGPARARRDDAARSEADRHDPVRSTDETGDLGRAGTERDERGIRDDRVGDQPARAEDRSGMEPPVAQDWSGGSADRRGTEQDRLSVDQDRLGADRQASQPQDGPEFRPAGADPAVPQDGARHQDEFRPLDSRDGRQDGFQTQESRQGEFEDDPFFRQEQQLRDQNGDLPPKAPEFGAPEDGIGGEGGDARR